MTKMTAPVNRSRANAAMLLPAFLRPRAIARFMKDGRASIGSKIFFVAAVAYVLLPIDLVPDIAPIVGWLDDVGAVSAALAWMASRISAHDNAQVIDVTAEPSTDQAR